MATVALSGIITPTNVVTATSTTTLSNKTLTAPTIASANLTTALTLTGAAGTSGQVLTSGGSGAAPTWTTVSGGSSQWTTTGSDIYYTTGKVGIGTSTFTSGGGKLQVSDGITFPATQSASSDANTLDDYEEGSWTPSIGGTATYSYRSGGYIKIGSLVSVNWDMEIGTMGTGSTQFISGLPFAFGGSRPQGGSISIASNVSQNFYSIYLGSAWGSTTEMGFGLQTGLDGSTTTANQTVFQAGTRISGSFTYDIRS